jgi:glycosyltransferase involved in cell wall biosynthesis
MACFGAARAEKGSDILQDAIVRYRHRHPGSRAHFTIQWLEDFASNDNAMVRKHPKLLSDTQVRFLTRYFVDGEYPAALQKTDVMLLPYRLSSYGLRGSRVVIEAAVNAIPTIVTRGTTLANLTERFGAGILVSDGDAESLAEGIRAAELQFLDLRREAWSRRNGAIEHFSVANFREVFLASNAPVESRSGMAMQLQA